MPATLLSRLSLLEWGVFEGATAGFENGIFLVICLVHGVGGVCSIGLFDDPGCLGVRALICILGILYLCVGSSLRLLVLLIRLASGVQGLFDHTVLLGCLLLGR